MGRECGGTACPAAQSTPITPPGCERTGAVPMAGRQISIPKGNVMGQIIAERIGKVMVVTIANEAKRNALNVAMEKPFCDCLVEADNDDSIRVVVITGAGDIAFCSGHDLSEVGQPGIQLMKPDPMGH